MPNWMSKPQEKDWKESVNIVKKEKDKPKKKFKDKDYALTMHIWKNKEKAHRGKKKKKSELFKELVACANDLDFMGLFSYADDIDTIIDNFADGDINDTSF